MLDQDLKLVQPLEMMKGKLAEQPQDLQMWLRILVFVLWSS